MLGVTVMNKCIIQNATWEYLVEGIIFMALQFHLWHPLVYDFPLKRWPSCRFPDSSPDVYILCSTILESFYLCTSLLCLPVTDCFNLAFPVLVTSFPSYCHPHFHNNHVRILRLNRLNYFCFFVISEALFCISTVSYIHTSDSCIVQHLIFLFFFVTSILLEFHIMPIF